MTYERVAPLAPGEPVPCWACRIEVGPGVTRNESGVAVLGYHHRLPAMPDCVICGGSGVQGWRDYSNVRGPQPRVQRRGPITDFIYFDGGLARVKCEHGKSWPEGDWCEGHGPFGDGRACWECVSVWRDQRAVEQEHRL